MAEAWRIARRSRTCARTGAAIEADQVFYSALLENGDEFAREDYTAEAWPEVDKGRFFSYWKNKPVAEAGNGKAKVDYERLLSFFDSLDGAVEPGRRLFRYVLALMLVRRRILRLDGTARTEEGDRLILWDRRITGALDVEAPEATPEQVAATQDKLNELFDYELEM